MVLIDKTYRGAKSLSGKISAAAMIIGGFFALLFMAAVKPSHFLGTESGVAHADVVSGGTDSGCTTGGCDTGCGGGASGCGSGDDGTSG